MSVGRKGEPQSKRARLEVQGWRLGSAQEFLGLSDRLVAHAARQDERSALGLFLELAGLLGGGRRSSRPLGVSGTDGGPSLASSSPASDLTPRTWPARGRPRRLAGGYLMNMPLDSFRTLFEKHARL